MTSRMLRIAVVGHTNTGKTSLLRTLTRDVAFGEVSESPGTTKEVSGCVLHVEGSPVAELYDTPGLEDSIGLLRRLESERTTHEAEGPDLVGSFLESPDAAGRFRQESKAIREILDSDVALYVIDARERVLSKYRDELRILGYCARPVVPVLNFVAGEHARTAEWRDQLARVNMHAVAEFDTVVLETGGEIRLFEKVRGLLDSFRDSLDALIADRRREREMLVSASARLIADLLIDAAAFTLEAQVRDDKPDPETVASLKEAISGREERCVRDLLQLHRFRPDDYLARPLPVEEGRWKEDPFSADALQEYGVYGGGGAAAGAMVGLTLDAMLHGLSLGAATAIGAAVGAVVGAGGGPGQKILRRLRGKTYLYCDDRTLKILAIRQIELTHALLHRGHADTAPLQVAADRGPEALAAGGSPDLRVLRRARRRPDWSRISSAPARNTTLFDAGGRERAAETLAAEVRKSVLDLDRQSETGHGGTKGRDRVSGVLSPRRLTRGE